MKKYITLLALLLAFAGMAQVKRMDGVIIDTLTTTELNAMRSSLKVKGSIYMDITKGYHVTWDAGAGDWVRFGNGDLSEFVSDSDLTFGNLLGSPTDNTALSNKFDEYVDLTNNQTLTGEKTLNNLIIGGNVEFVNEYSLGDYIERMGNIYATTGYFLTSSAPGQNFLIGNYTKHLEHISNGNLNYTDMTRFQVIVDSVNSLGNRVRTTWGNPYPGGSISTTQSGYLNFETWNDSFHISGAGWTFDDFAGNGNQALRIDNDGKVYFDDIPGGAGGTDDQNASEVPYTDTHSIGETDVQGAIDFLAPKNTYIDSTATTLTLSIANASIGSQYVEIDGENSSDIIVSIDDTGLTDNHYFVVRQKSSGRLKMDFEDDLGRRLQTANLGDYVTIKKDGADYRVKADNATEWSVATNNYTVGNSLSAAPYTSFGYTGLTGVGGTLNAITGTGNPSGQAVRFESGDGNSDRVEETLTLAPNTLYTFSVWMSEGAGAALGSFVWEGFDNDVGSDTDPEWTPSLSTADGTMRRFETSMKTNGTGTQKIRFYNNAASTTITLADLEIYE